MRSTTPGVALVKTPSCSTCLPSSVRTPVLRARPSFRPAGLLKVRTFISTDKAPLPEEDAKQLKELPSTPGHYVTVLGSEEAVHGTSDAVKLQLTIQDLEQQGLACPLPNTHLRSRSGSSSSSDSDTEAPEDSLTHINAQQAGTNAIKQSMKSQSPVESLDDLDDVTDIQSGDASLGPGGLADWFSNKDDIITLV